MYVTAIVLAAGKSLRFKSKISKPLVRINSKPAIIYCLSTFSKESYINDIVVVVNSKNSVDIARAIRRYGIGKIKKLVLGGRRRQDSVYNGLIAIDPKTDLVLIHDAARPFIDKKIVSAIIKEAKNSGAAITAVPIKATIKKVTSLEAHQVTSKLVVDKTIDRDGFWEAQTPQVFRKDLILKAYKKFRNIDVTDDAALIEKLGVKIRVVMDSYFNIKITTLEDLKLAEAICKIKK